MSYIQIPPDSTGKQLRTVQRTSVDYDGQTVAFTVGDIVDGASSGASGTITAIITDGFGVNEGRLYLKDVLGIFINNETLEVGATPHAFVNTTTNAVYDRHVQQTIISDPDNPQNQQRVDRFGATVNTFNDGSPVFSPFGALMVGQQQTIKDYRFAYDSLRELFWDQTVGTGSISWEDTTTALLLSTGTGSGASAIRTTNYYHPYVPGVGSLVEMTIDVGDVGKANVVRRWGLFDDNNGVFWELSGTTLSVVVRSNTSGSPVDSAVAQSSFNTDRLDGSGKTGFELDITKGNIYFIDLQWLGAGRVRFGIIDESGSRINAHIFEHANQINLPYMRTATLPLRVSQVNVGVAGSTSELRWVCGTVKHTSKVEIEKDRHTAISNVVQLNSSSGEVPVISFRPRRLYKGNTNRGVVKFDTGSLRVQSPSGNSSAVIWRFRTGLVGLTGNVFNEVSNTHSIMEFDTTSTAIVTDSNTHINKSAIINPDSTEFLSFLGSDTTNHEYELYLSADGNTQPIGTVTAELLENGTANVACVVNWGEIKL